MVTDKQLRATQKQIKKVYQAYLQGRPSFVSRFPKEQVIDMITNHLLAEQFKRLEDKEKAA